MPKKMGLGRGLDALLPEIDDQETVVREIPIAEIDRNPRQPRRAFDEEALRSLSDVPTTLAPLGEATARNDHRDCENRSQQGNNDEVRHGDPHNGWKARQHVRSCLHRGIRHSHRSYADESWTA